MAQSIDIKLPRAHRARFPDRCVLCGCANPKSHVRLITGTLGWWTWLLFWWGKPFVAKAPACAGCAWKLQGLRFLSLAATVATAVAVFWLIGPSVKAVVPHVLRKWVMAAFAMVGLIPQLVFEVFLAKPFEVTAFADNVHYEFTSQEYAAEFVVLNMDARWIKINGATFRK